MIVNKLLFIRTGKYHEQVQRPYVAHVTPEKAALLAEMTHGAQRLEVSNVAGLASQIFMPNPTPQGNVDIVHGWGQTRLRFMMEIIHESMDGNNRIQYLTGWTDYDGLSTMGDHVDPKMQMTINNTITTRNQRLSTAYGVVDQVMLSNASQVLQGPVLHNYRQMETAVHTARPMDIFGTIGSIHDAGSGFGGSPLFDLRSPFTEGPMKLSSRSNGLPANYLSKVLKTYRNTMASADMSADMSSLANNMAGAVGEQSISTDGFMGNMMREGTSLTEGTTFTYAELVRFAQGTQQNTKVIMPSTPIEQPRDYRNYTESWNGVNNESLLATILMNAVPSIMIDFMVTDMSIHMTNQTIGGQANVWFSDIASFSGMDMRPYEDPIRQRLLTEVFRDITHNGMKGIDIHARFNMLGDSAITIRYESNPAVEYVAPSFCDALLAPVVTNSLSTVRDIATDVDSLANTIGAVNLAPQVSPVIQGAQNFGGQSFGPLSDQRGDLLI